MKRKFRYCLLGALLFAMSFFCLGCGAADRTKVDKVQQETTVENADAANEDTENVQGNDSVEPEELEEKYTFPLILDSGKLELSSVFEYDGINPDYGDAYGEKISSVQVKNISGTYLKKAEMMLTLSNGTVLEFLLEDIPADMEVMAFELQNQTEIAGERIEDIQVTAEYEDTNAQEKFSWSVNGNEITIENISDQDLQNVTVYYHCSIGELSYGGTSYEMSAGNIGSKESVTISDSYCFVGDVNVVNVTHE